MPLYSEPHSAWLQVRKRRDQPFAPKLVKINQHPRVFARAFNRHHRSSTEFLMRNPPTQT
jgi:hypothetical protein